MHPVVDELAKLPVSERLEIVQQLWDSIASSQGEIVIQPWHREVVRERLAEFEGRESEVGLSVEGEGFTFDLQRAAPCALLLNELITNSLKLIIDLYCSQKQT